MHTAKPLPSSRNVRAGDGKGRGGSAVATSKQGTWNAERSESKIDNFQHVCIALRTVIKYSIYDRYEMFIAIALLIIIANKKKKATTMTNV